MLAEPNIESGADIEVSPCSVLFQCTCGFERGREL
jgi:hypothetical protein